MSQHFARLFPTPQGLSLAGTIIARRSPDGLFEVDDNSHAQIQAAYGRPLSPRALGYITRACAEFAKVSSKDLEYASYPAFPSPHGKTTQSHAYTPLTKGLMLLALSGLNDLPDPAQGRARLLKMQADKAYNPNQPRVPAGHGKESGQWTAGNDSDVGSGDDSDDLSDDDFYFSDDASESDDADDADDASNDAPGYDRDSISTDDVRNAVAEGMDDASSLPGGVEMADDTSVPLLISDQTVAAPPEDKSSIEAVPVILNDGSTVTDPATGNPILMPPNVSLQANAAFGESIRNLPSIADGLSYPAGVYFPLDDADLEEPDNYDSKEDLMISQFLPGNPMDYQRVSSDLQDENGNPLIDRTYINFGNFNYGVVSAAAGYNLDQTLAAAATLNQFHAATNPNIDTSGLYGGNARNEYFIQMGYAAYTSGKISGDSQ